MYTPMAYTICSPAFFGFKAETVLGLKSPFTEFYYILAAEKPNS